MSTPEHTHFAGHAHITLVDRAARPRIEVSLCDTQSGGTPAHAVRFAHPNGQGFDGTTSTMASAERAVAQIARDVGGVAIRRTARLGRGGSSLPFMPAASVRPGMAMFDQDGGYDIVETVERVALDRPVYDLDVEHTHNFVAEGIVTHNSIYGFRGADIANILEF